jgi:hypothetical protein
LQEIEKDEEEDRVFITRMKSEESCAPGQPVKAFREPNISLPSVLYFSPSLLYEKI